MNTTTVQMFIMILLTQIKLPLKESEASMWSRCIFLSWKICETQNMEFLRRFLENIQEIHLNWSWLILPIAEEFLHPKLQVCNLITYTVCVSISNWKVFMNPWLVDNDQMTITMKNFFSAKIMYNVIHIYFVNKSTLGKNN